MEDSDDSKKKTDDGDEEYLKWNEDLMRHVLPKEMEADFVASVFEIGLRNSSPKVLMQLMPLTNSLTTEHIKSHLQKYRLHYTRSKEEFLQYYDSHLKRDFEDFVSQEGWRNTEALLAQANGMDTEGDGGGSSAATTGQEPGDEDENALVDDLDEVPIEVIQELNDKIVHEQMQLQATLQHHIMVQTRLQKAMHDQLKKLRSDSGGGGGANGPSPTAGGGARGPGGGGPVAMEGSRSGGGGDGQI
mmetsp:Transcript_2589/g.4114  ORF Transcript_2589/g.4114 Transcript_2589/m.4114 type:complete len:245 (-) Transcript_2589:269-1003(-)